MSKLRISPGCFQFDDVTVWEFLAVQLDMSQYRSSWDTSTAQCHQVETEDTGVTDTGD